MNFNQNRNNNQNKNEQNSQNKNQNNNQNKNDQNKTDSDASNKFWELVSKALGMDDINAALKKLDELLNSGNSNIFGSGSLKNIKKSLF